MAFQRREGRFVHSTPKTYLELLKLYGTLLEAKREANDTATARLANGIDTLDQRASAVKELEVRVEGEGGVRGEACTQLALPYSDPH